MKTLALLLSRIPVSCPFARDIRLFRITFHIPPLCKLNPFYNQLMAARWWALEYLEEQR